MVVACSLTCTRCGTGDRVDVWLRERNQTMIFRILFEDRVSGTVLNASVLDCWRGTELKYSSDVRDCRYLLLNRRT